MVVILTSNNTQEISMKLSRNIEENIEKFRVSSIKIFETSYFISLKIAQQKKPHAFGETYGILHSR